MRRRSCLRKKAFTTHPWPNWPGLRRLLPLLYHYYRDKEHILFDIADSYGTVCWR